jgi:tetratricopeptide (TPR) repeat protein
LRRDPLDSRCNNAMGFWHFRRGEFTEAEKYFRQAIERLTRRNAHPSDGEPYYNLGLCLRYLGRDDEAYDALYKSVWNQAWVAAGCHALAEFDCARKNWAAALEHLNQSLRHNKDNLRARNLKVLVLRRLGREEEASSLLRQTLALDPLDCWARLLNQEPLHCDWQTRLDLAHDLARAAFLALFSFGRNSRRRKARHSKKSKRNSQIISMVIRVPWNHRVGLAICADAHTIAENPFSK